MTRYHGYWWPGAYLAPGHLQPSCWRKPIPKFQVLNEMSHIHHQGISAVVADGLQLTRHQYICKHHVDVDRYLVRVLNSVIIQDESAWLLLMVWYLLGRPLGCPYFIHWCICRFFVYVPIEVLLCCTLVGACGPKAMKKILLSCLFSIYFHHSCLTAHPVRWAQTWVEKSQSVWCNVTIELAKNRVDSGLV